MYTQRTFVATASNTEEIGKGPLVREFFQLRQHLTAVLILPVTAISERHRRQRHSEWVDRTQILTLHGAVGVLFRIKCVN